jgi:hypothetical protein
MRLRFHWCVPPYFDCVFLKVFTSLGTDGTNPSSVSQTAAGLSSSSNTASGALGSFPMTSLAVSLSALASAFAFFA